MWLLAGLQASAARSRWHTGPLPGNMECARWIRTFEPPPAWAAGERDRMNHFSDKVNLIWDIADTLRGPYRPPRVPQSHAPHDRPPPPGLRPQGPGVIDYAKPRCTGRRALRKGQRRDRDGQPGRETGCRDNRRKLVLRLFPAAFAFEHELRHYVRRGRRGVL